MVRLITVALVLGGYSASLVAAHEVPAFPGAEGFGAGTPGGHGANIVEVTNLNDDGPGSGHRGSLVIPYRPVYSLQLGPAIIRPLHTVNGADVERP